MAPLAVLPDSQLLPGSQVLLLNKLPAPRNHLESTLLQVFILKTLKPPGIKLSKKLGRGWVLMVNQVLETSHLPSSPAQGLRVSVAAPSSVLSTQQCPFRNSPLTGTPKIPSRICFSFQYFMKCKFHNSFLLIFMQLVGGVPTLLAGNSERKDRAEQALPHTKKRREISRDRA
jgi:hypothetical protein